MIETDLTEKFNKLKEIIKGLENVAVGFSGGVDSTFLLKVAVDILGSDNVLAVTSCSETYPSREFKEASRLVEEIGVEQYVIHSEELDNEDFVRNDKLRCYYCKKELFSEIKEVAREEGYKNVADGSNYDDQINDYRPGLKAADELGIRSPLKEAEITKEEIRKLSKRLGLPTWNKPSFACLSSRFPYGSRINEDELKMVDKAEEFLRKYSFKQLRVRHHDQHTARIEVLPEDMELLLKEREEIVSLLKELGYIYITIDLEGYRTGSMNEVL